MLKLTLNRRVLANVAIAVAVGVGSAAGVGFAQGNGKGDGAGTSTVAASPSNGILAGVHGALENLVAQGTISQSQADAVQAQADAGSIDPKQLVDSGVVSDAQMRAVANSIDAVKRAAG
jgi:hypothetical protein